MRIAFHDYGGKGRRIAAALEHAGHTLVADTGDVALVDIDVDYGIQGDLCERHDRVVVYPHGGEPVFAWDGRLTPHPHTRLQVTHGVGQADVLARYGYPVRCEPVGWAYSDVAPPRYPANPRRVLFGPIHYDAFGVDRAGGAPTNEAAHERLVAAGYEVTVRRGATLAHDDVDAADVVVASGSLGCLAAARGVPVVWLGSYLVPNLADDGPLVAPTHWVECRGVCRYPYDVDDGPISDLVAAVCRRDDAVEEWRHRVIGGPLDVARVAELFEEVAA